MQSSSFAAGYCKIVRMTLNITVLSPRGIHQSADFQLSEPEQDTNGNWVVVQENASKIVALHFKRWSGLLTYCGVGLWNGMRTDQVASEWLSRIGWEATFHQALEAIRSNGSAWIAGINKASGRVRPHTFVLAAFEEGTLCAAVLSNYQTLNGDLASLMGDLQVDARPVRGTTVFVTGIRNAVAEADRRLLKHIAETVEDYAVVQQHLADVNRRAAANAKGGISKSCLTYTSGPTGQQSSRVHGDVQGPLQPLAADGEGMLAAMLAEFTRQNPNAKVLQSGYSNTEAQAEEISENIKCQLRFASGFADRERPSVAEVEEFGSINEYSLDVTAINNDGSTVGNVRTLPDARVQAFFSPSDKEILELGTFGGPLSYALDLNERGQVVGTAGVDDQGWHAFIWTQNDGLVDLGTLGGRNSMASSINDHGVVVGKSGCHPGEPRLFDEHAFIWTPESKMVRLDPEFEGWSRACAINNLGWVIGWCGRTVTECGYVWCPELGFIELRIGTGRPFFVAAINDAGLVVGQGDDETGTRRAYSWTLEAGIRRLGTDELFHPRRVSADGTIIGSVSGGASRWERPFVYTHAGGLVPLPYAEDHHTDVSAINDHRIILGAARRSGSWKHVHQLRWRISLQAG